MDGEKKDAVQAVHVGVMPDDEDEKQNQTMLLQISETTDRRWLKEWQIVSGRVLVLTAKVLQVFTRDVEIGGHGVHVECFKTAEPKSVYVR